MSALFNSDIFRTIIIIIIIIIIIFVWDLGSHRTKYESLVEDQHDISAQGGGLRDWTN